MDRSVPRHTGMFYRTRKKQQHKEPIRKMGAEQKRIYIVRNALFYTYSIDYAKSWAVSNGRFVKMEASSIGNRDVGWNGYSGNTCHCLLQLNGCMHPCTVVSLWTPFLLHTTIRRRALARFIARKVFVFPLCVFRSFAFKAFFDSFLHLYNEFYSFSPPFLTLISFFRPLRPFFFPAGPSSTFMSAFCVCDPLSLIRATWMNVSIRLFKHRQHNSGYTTEESDPLLPDCPPTTQETIYCQ